MKYSARFSRLRGTVEQSPATLLEDEAALDIDGSTTGILPWLLFDGTGIILLPPPSTVQFYDRIAFSGKLYRRRRGEMTDLWMAVQDIRFVPAQAFQCPPLILRQIDRAWNASLGVVFSSPNVNDIDPRCSSSSVRVPQARWSMPSLPRNESSLRRIDDRDLCRHGYLSL
jgi:hypothetical protein